MVTNARKAAYFSAMVKVVILLMDIVMDHVELNIGDHNVI